MIQQVGNGVKPIVVHPRNKQELVTVYHCMRAEDFACCTMSLKLVGKGVTISY